MSNPEDSKLLLKVYSSGAFSGNLSEWPQLKPLLRWANERIEELEGEVERKNWALLFYSRGNHDAGEMAKKALNNPKGEEL